MLAIATHRKPLTWVTLRYVALKCKAARPFTSTALHLTPLPFLSHLPCRRVWLIVVFVCPFCLLFNCAEAVSEGGGESVDKERRVVSYCHTTSPFSACLTCSTYPQLLTEREIYSSIGLFTVCTAYSGVCTVIEQSFLFLHRYGIFLVYFKILPGKLFPYLNAQRKPFTDNPLISITDKECISLNHTPLISISDRP